MDPFRQEMTFEEYLNFPRTLGWKHEYYGGALHRSPAWTSVASFRASLHALSAIEIDRRADVDRGLGTLAVRVLVNEDHSPLLKLFCECFEQAIEYAGCRSSDIIKYAHKSLDRFFGDSPAAYSDACRVAILHGNIVGASTIAECEPGAILQPIFVAPAYQRLGLATRLLTVSAKSLLEQGYEELHSRCNLGNEASMAWHAKCGFVEVPEELPAGHRANIYSQEAERQERLNLPTAKEMRALADHWRNERDRLRS
jgi:GNAT superfamily N-acetyltransferase